MKNKLLMFTTMVAGLLLATAPVFAHHGTAGYDNTKVVTESGTITDFQFINPHCIVAFDVKDASGDVQHWTLETNSPSTMKHNSGWYKDMMKPGDQITVSMHVARNGAFVGKIAGTGNMTLNGKPIRATSETE